MRLIITYSFLLACAPSMAIEHVAPLRLDLHGAIQFALENSPTLQTERYQRLIRELEHSNARTKFFPTLDVTSTHGIQTTETKRPTDPWASQVGLRLTETLYDNGQSFTNFKLTDVRRQVAELSVQKTRDFLTLDVASQFYTYSQAHKLAEIKQKQLTLLRKQFASVEGQYKQGMKLRKDYLRLKGQIQRAEIDERNAVNDIEKNAISLKNLIGMMEDKATIEFIAIEITDLPTIPSKAALIDTSYEYRIAKLESSQSPLEADLAKRKYWPEIGLSAGANYQTSNYLGPTGRFGDNTQYGWNVLLALNYSIWDWGSRWRDVEIAETKVQIAETGFRKTSLETMANLRTLMVDINRLSANYKVAKELMAAEEESYDFIRREYGEGKVQYLDLITSLNDQLDAKVRYYSSYYDLASVLAKYYYYSGNLYDKITRH